MSINITINEDRDENDDNSNDEDNDDYCKLYITFIVVYLLIFLYRQNNTVTISIISVAKVAIHFILAPDNIICRSIFSFLQHGIYKVPTCFENFQIY